MRLTREQAGSVFLGIGDGIHCSIVTGLAYEASDSVWFAAAVLIAWVVGSFWRNVGRDLLS